MNFRFEKRLPSPQLSKYVQQYYLFEGPNPGLVNKIPSWTRPVMAIQWDDTTTITVGGKPRKSDAISINGIITKPYELYTEGRSYHFFSIEFTATGLYALFKEHISKFTDHSVNVFDIIPARKKWGLIEALGDAFQMEEKVAIIERFLMQFLPSKLQEWNLRHVKYALAIMNQKQGNVTLKEITQTLQRSDRHLRRVFKEVVGVSPKKYLRLLRFEQGFNKVLTEGYTPPLLTDQDYYDQAHFINEIKQFSGVSPTKIDAATYQFSKFFT